jgi:hypothetical protein
MKPSFESLSSNYYSSNEFKPNYKSGIDLYAEIGISQEKLMGSNPAYINTCAARMSLALLKSGVRFSGRMSIPSGALQGRKLETGAKLLADQLSRADVFGRPEIFNKDKFREGLTGRKGVVFFWKLDTMGGDHIDLVDATSGDLFCSSSCFQAREVWFWPLR